MGVLSDYAGDIAKGEVVVRDDASWADDPQERCAAVGEVETGHIGIPVREDDGEDRGGGCNVLFFV